MKIEDFDGSFGGRIKNDKLWFMLTGRDQVTFTQAGASQLSGRLARAFRTDASMLVRFALPIR